MFSIGMIILKSINKLKYNDIIGLNVNSEKIDK